MDIRYIYMRRHEADLSDSRWIHSREREAVRSQALSHAANVMRCSLLVMERDPSTGYMAPVGFAAIL